MLITIPPSTAADSFAPKLTPAPCKTGRWSRVTVCQPPASGSPALQRPGGPSTGGGGAGTRRGGRGRGAATLVPQGEQGRRGRRPRRQPARRRCPPAVTPRAAAERRRAGGAAPRRDTRGEHGAARPGGGRRQARPRCTHTRGSCSGGAPRLWKTPSTKTPFLPRQRR